MTIKTIRLKKTHPIFIKHSDREVKTAIILLSLFAGAMIIGASAANSEFSLSTEIQKVFDYYLDKRINQTILENISSYFSVNMLLIIITYCCGLSCIGLLPLALIPVFSGLGLGILAGKLFENYNMTGIGYYLLTVFPSKIIFVTILIISGVNAISMSVDILSLATEKKTENTVQSIKNYTVKFLFIMIATLISSVVNAFLTKAFGVMIAV